MVVVRFKGHLFLSCGHHVDALRRGCKNVV